MGSALSVRATNGSDVTERARRGATVAIRTDGRTGTRCGDAQERETVRDAAEHDATVPDAPPPMPHHRRHPPFVKAVALRVAFGEP